MGDEYIVITTAQGPAAEDQVRTFLEANGVPTQVRRQVARLHLPITVDACQVLVPRELETKARELLARVERGELELSEEEDRSESESDSLESPGSAFGFTLLGVFLSLVGLFLIMRAPRLGGFLLLAGVGTWLFGRGFPGRGGPT